MEQNQTSAEDQTGLAAAPEKGSGAVKEHTKQAPQPVEEKESTEKKLTIDAIRDHTDSLSNFIRSARNLTISFLSVLLYVGVSAWSTTDLDLLKNTPIRLPLIGLEIPLQGFYVIVPWLVFAIFFNLMFHLQTISARSQWLLDLHDQDPVEYCKVVDRLPIYPFITLCFSHNRPLMLSVLFAALFLFTEVIAPLLIVTLLLLKFLAYQNSGASWSQWAAVCFCAATAIFFWRQILSQFGKTITIARYANWFVTGIGAIAILATCFLVYVSPAVLYDRVDKDLDKLLIKYRYWHAAVDKASEATQAEEAQRSQSNADTGRTEDPPKLLKITSSDSRLPLGLSDWMRIQIGPGELVVKNQPAAEHINQLTRSDGGDGAQQLQVANSLKHILGVDLSERLLIGTQLSEAYLPNAILGHVKLVDANLERTNLTGATVVRKTILKEVKMYRANMTSAKIKDSTWLDSPLVEVSLSKAEISDMNFSQGAVVEKIQGLPAKCKFIDEQYRVKFFCPDPGQPEATVASLSNKLLAEISAHETTQIKLDKVAAEHKQLQSRTTIIEQELKQAETNLAELQGGANANEILQQQLDETRVAKDALSRQVETLKADLNEQRLELEQTMLALQRAKAGQTSTGQPPETAATPLIECEVCPEMVKIPAGSFMMGSPKGEKQRSSREGPQHEVKIESFYLSRYEVTFDQWDACVKEDGCSHNPNDYGWGRGKRPVVGVSWDDAQEYIEWIKNKTKKTYRLPSEAEWEYAARAETTTAFWWGDSITTDQANYDGNYTYNGPKGVYREKTLPVGSFEANRFGLYDVHGNVYEWVDDCWNDSYKEPPKNGTARLSGDCALRVLRGGSWGSEPWWLRSANRFWNHRANRGGSVGFRLARTL